MVFLPVEWRMIGWGLKVKAGRLGGRLREEASEDLDKTGKGRASAVRRLPLHLE